MSKAITIMDGDYVQWMKEIAVRYRRCQIKASIKVNQEMLQFYWDLGHDIVSRHAENKYGGKFYASISRDLQSLLPNIEGLSERNIRYCKKFYILYSQVDRILPQVVAKSDGDSQKADLPQVVAELSERPSILEKLCAVPWGHHRLIMDKCQDDVQKAWFFVNKVIEDSNGFSPPHSQAQHHESP